MLRIAITLPGFMPGEASFIVRLLDESFDRVHIRKPDADALAVAQLIEGVPKAYRSRLVLHDHHVLAERYGLGGIHLNYRNPVAPAGFQGSVSRSCHSLDEVRAWKPRCAYVFLSPIYDSISKQGYRSAFSKQTLLKASAEGIIDQQVVALGGVSYQRLAEVEQLGLAATPCWAKPGKDGVGAFSYFAAFMWRLRTIAHTPRAMSGMLNNWPMSSGRLASKASCTSLVNSMKKRKVNTSVRQRPK